MKPLKLLTLFIFLIPLSLHAHKDFYYIRPFTCKKEPEIRIPSENFTRLFFHEVLSDTSLEVTVSSTPPEVREPWSILVSGSYGYRGENLSLEFEVVNHTGTLIYYQSIPDVPFEWCREFVSDELRSLFFDIEIESLPPGADVTVKGRPVDRTFRLPRGTYNFRLRHEKCEDTTCRIRIPEEREKRIILEPSKGDHG